ncbi:recombinase family protein [Deinococcus oregonensis]|uniref:Recombinase family protein n=1 Tax=Deinococcus oregonensis TaxID=1805970 RepID=A0ABV6B802_9DEIO
MRIGYARVSTREQNLDRQTDALAAAGCERVYLDKISSRREFTERPQWSKMWEALRAGDVLVIHEIDRMGRDLRDLLNIIHELDQAGVKLEVLNGPFSTLDPSSPLGGVLLAVALEFTGYERSINRSRTLDGLAAARKRGVKGGRKYSLSESDRALCVALYRDPNVSVASIAKRFGVSVDSVRNYARQAEAAKIEDTTISANAAGFGAITNAALIPGNGNFGGKPQAASEGPPSVSPRGGKRFRHQ